MARMNNKARSSSPSPSWLEALLLVLFTFLVLLFAAARSQGAEPPSPAAASAASSRPAGNDAPTAAFVRGLELLGAPTDLAHAGSGELLLRTAASGVYLPAPTVDTDVALRVSGFVDRARVRQRFHNPTSAWVEGVYVFALPAGAAVDTLRMKIGDRVIAGLVQEREEAKRTYDAAKAAGRKTSLVEQERPNVFTTAIANLGPDEDVEVEIEYEEELRYDDGRFELRFPMVVAPRYVPGEAGPERPTHGAWSPDTTTVPDASRITPPVTPPATPAEGSSVTPPATPLEDALGAGGRSPVRVTVDLDAGFDLAAVTSPSHAIVAEPGAGRAVTVRLAAGRVPADRDFVLRWSLAPDAKARAAAFTEDRPEGRYALLMVVPPLGAHEETPLAPRPPREEIFVVDTSGSMAGESIVQAKEALRFALSTLRADDRFNIIQFNSVTSRLFDAPEMAFPDAIAKASSYVDGLEANGGTEMRAALETALGESAEASGALRQVIFMTDGSVGNEDELFTYIQAHLGASRLFTVGIGSAPNSHFLRKAAEFGRGTFTYVGSPKEVAERMGGLFRKLERPVLTDLAVTFDDSMAESWPERLPDAYAGEPVTVAVRLTRAGGQAHLRGVRGVEPWAASLALDGASREGIEKLWARRKVGALMDAEIEGKDAATVRSEVVAVALEHHLVSDFTSLVAVDVTPTVPQGERPRTVLLPVNLPSGWEFEEGWAGLPQTATPRDLLGLGALVFFAIALLLRFAERS